MEQQFFGPYRKIRPIASGASASVFEAEHTTIKRRAAVKLLHPHLIGDLKSVERLRREAEAIARLDHKNIVKVYDCNIGSGESGSWIACEYIDGWTLRDFRNSIKDFRSEFAVFIAILVAEALKSAHSIDIVHRDLKPENILVGRDGSLKLADFGIATMQENERLTLTGALLGSPGYMAPEQIDGGGVDKRADVFSFGVLCYWLLTGKEPFAGPTSAKTLRNSAEGRYLSANMVQPTVNRSFSLLIDKCLRSSPEERFGSLEEILAVLNLLNEAYCFGSPEQEFRDLCLNGKKYCAGCTDKIVQGMKRALADNRFDKLALDLASQAILLFPHDKEMVAKAKKFTGRQNRGSLLKSAALVLTAVLVALFLVMVLNGKKSISAPNSSALSPDVRDSALTRSEAVSVVKRDTIKPLALKQIVKNEKKIFVDSIVKEGPVSPVSTPMTDTQKVNSFAAEQSLLKVYSKPWARVSVDGVYAGKTPFLGELRLSGGKHVIFLDNPYCHPVYDTVELIGGQTLERRYELTAKDKKVE